MVGVNYGWTSPLIGKLSRPNPPFEATSEEISWIASLTSLCQPIGVIIGTLITRYVGSKNSILFSGTSFLISWTTLALSTSIETVYLTYIISGIGMGALATSSPVFISEIASPKINGTLMSTAFQGLLLGILLGNILGTLLDPWVMACLFILPAIFFLTTFIWFNETPFYCICKNDIDKAKKSLEFYNPKRDMSLELQNLVDFINSRPDPTLLQSIAKFKEPINWYTLLIVNVIYSIVQLNGFYTLLEYMEVLFINAEITIITPAYLVTIVSIIGVVSSWVAICIVDRFGRVTLLFSAFLVMAVTLFCWGFKYHLQDLGFHDERLQWFVIISSCVYRMSIVIGFASVSPTILSEIFAPDVKNFAICFCNITLSLCSFISNKNFQLMVDNFTYKYVFYLFATVTLAVSIYCKICIPETKGKSLNEIQDILNKRIGKKLDTQNNSTQEAASKV